MATPAFRFVPALTTTIAALTTLWAFNAAAQNRPPIKPGLWEVKQTRTMNGQQAPDMSEHLKNLPPEARKRMQEQMRQSGVEMGAGGLSKICLSAEMLARDDWASGQADCKTEMLSRSAGVWKWRSSCTQPPTTAEGETRFQGDSGYTTVVDLTSQHQGQPQKMHMEMQGRWLGADCGSLKPFKPMTAPKGAPPAKP